MEKAWRTITGALLASCALASCGGGDGGGSTSPAVGSAPMPTPAPSTAPTPTPAPTPATTSFTAGLGSALVGWVLFDSNENGEIGDGGDPKDPSDDDIEVATNRRGEFGRDALDKLVERQPPSPATPLFAFQVGGIDAATGFIYTGMRAPKGASVASPATSLLRSIDDEVLVANTGLGIGARALATFAAVPAMSDANSATAALGRRVTAFNLKLAAFAAGNAKQRVPATDSAIRFDDTLYAVAERLASGPTNLNDETTVHAILERTGVALYASADQREAAAQLLARFATAVDIYLTTPDRVAAIQYGLRLIVLPEMAQLYANASNSTTRVREITVSDLVAAFHDFEELPSPSQAIQQTGVPAFVAVPDVREIPRRSINDAIQVGADCNAYYRAFFCNDVDVNISVAVDALALRITAVRVPAMFRDRVSAALSADQSVVLKRLNGATGLVWVEYDVENREGRKATGRAFLRLAMD